MFSETVVYITTPKSEHHKNIGDTSYSFHPEDYFIEINPSLLFKFMKAIYDFKRFKLSYGESVTIPST